MVHIRLAEIRKPHKLSLVLPEGTIDFKDGRATVSEEIWEAVPAKFKGPGKGIDIDPDGGKKAAKAESAAVAGSKQKPRGSRTATA